MRKKMIAMLLAGGQGSRLYALTKDLAKPAVPFGGKYRIIDFPLSNCVHSGIDTVGILTQYEPFVLSQYIGGGQSWDLNRTGGVAFILPPYQRSGKSDWYRGTANAVYQNLNFIRRWNPEYVAVLSGDHIYKMNYSKMLAAHIAANAACTVAVIPVPLKEASRFGILSTDEHDRITEFEEKPKQPKSNLASMGIYIFSADKLEKYLTEDEANPASQNDFGKNVIPAMLKAGERLCAYRFEGYWKDVGTVESLWEANMDLLAEHPALDLYDQSWKIYSKNPVMPPHVVEKGAVIHNSMVTEGCTVSGLVLGSVLFAGVKIEAGATVEHSIVMPGAIVHAGAHICRAVIGEGAEIGKGAAVGEAGGKIALVGPFAKAADNSVIPGGTVFGREELK